jgi:quinol monooxygenase YgiN
MAHNFHVVIQFEGKLEQPKLLSAILEELIDPSRAESGCIRYESFADLSNPNRFVVIEEWERQAQWQAHLQTPHVQKALVKLEGVMEKPFTVQPLRVL